MLRVMSRHIPPTDSWSTKYWSPPENQIRQIMRQNRIRETCCSQGSSGHKKLMQSTVLRQCQTFEL